MQEAEVRTALTAYATDGEPPMGLTADGVLTAGRRSRRARRLAAFAGAGVAAALVGVAAVVVYGGGAGGEDFVAADPCPVRPGARPAGEISADQALSPNLVAWATTSLTCRLNDEVPRLLPHARYAPAPGVQAGPLIGFTIGGEPPWGNRVDSISLIRDDQGTGDLTVTVGVVKRSAGAEAKAGCLQETVSQCSVEKGPHGEIVLFDTELADPSPDNPRNNIVYVYRGQTEVMVQASNTDRRAADGAPAATRPQPVLSKEQVIELALSPELYLFP
ncbi:hypothetical protein [Actinoplanes sp. NPDC026619]|uniref:hypothetical protein n=1 Tax=Actinoplanes sp. NPDC026619 TaxID=3155798 RepID=UPI0033DB5BD2